MSCRACRDIYKKQKVDFPTALEVTGNGCAGAAGDVELVLSVE